MDFVPRVSPPIAGLDLAGGRPGVQLKLGLTKTMINNARQLSRSLIGIYHYRELKLKRFGGRPIVSAWEACDPGLLDYKSVRGILYRDSWF